jgi:hypothetical protein
MDGEEQQNKAEEREVHVVTQKKTRIYVFNQKFVRQVKAVGVVE